MIYSDAAAATMTDQAVREIAQAIARSDYSRAGEVAERALAGGLVHPTFFNARAMVLERHGRDAEALAAYRQALQYLPKSPTILNAIGLCLVRLHRPEEALDAFETAIRIAPALAASHQRRGMVLGQLGRDQAAEGAYRRAIALEPRNAEALAGLASIAGRRGSHEAAAAYAQRALNAQPDNASAHAALALGEIARGEYGAAELRLSPLLSSQPLPRSARAAILGLLGDALDGQDRTAEAFHAWQSSNEELRAIHSQRFPEGTGLPLLAERLGAWLEASDGEAWRARADTPAATERRHAFLLGFHRSGTTLLGRVLASHPDVLVIEENDLLADFAEQYLTSAEGVDNLANMSADAAAIFTCEYWQRVDSLGPQYRDGFVVDKHPLNTLKLPLIRKLFPHARIVFALRDPRDVILSCFRRHFEINAAMFEYLELEGAARLYDRVMGLAEMCRRKLALDVFEHRYEDMVADFDARMRVLCTSLGLEWNPGMRDFASAAEELDSRSVSSPQVKRGLYREGVGQWRRYEKELLPVLPLLQPWITRFGYAS